MSRSSRRGANDGRPGSTGCKAGIRTADEVNHDQLNGVMAQLTVFLQSSTGAGTAAYAGVASNASGLNDVSASVSSEGAIDGTERCVSGCRLPHPRQPPRPAEVHCAPGLISARVLLRAGFR